MKRIIAALCAVLMLFTSGAAYADKEISFSTKKDNPLLDLPISEEIIMKNGSVVLEVENGEYQSCMAMVTDTEASGERALKTAGGVFLTDHTLEKKPSVRLKFIVDKENAYNVWIRTRTTTTTDYITMWTDLGSNDNYTLQTLRYGENTGSFVWSNLGKQRYSEGVNYINFKYRTHNSAIWDKVIVTSDPNFTPTGKDDTPFDESGDDVAIDTKSIPVYPTKGQHPRLYFTAEEIPAIKEKLTNSLFKTSYEKLQEEAAQKINCPLPKDNSDYTSYSSYLDVLTARAFLYAIGERDASFAKETVKLARDFVETVTFDKSDTTYGSRYMGNTMVMAACVYDWCYSSLTDDDKAAFIKKLPEFASATEVGYPPTKRSYVISHGTESLIYRDQLAPAIALYDEFPDWYNIVGTIIFSKLIPVKNFLNSSGTDFSGSTYSEARNAGAIHAEKMIHTLGYSDSIFGEAYPEMFRKFVYERLPNGIWFKEGDDYAWDRYRPDTRSPIYGKMLRYMGSQYDDPVLLGQGLIDLAQIGYTTDVFDILMTDTSAEASAPTELPLTRFTKYPMSTMLARTSWQNGINSPTAMAYVNMREVTVGDHQHRDLGAFQLWYKGMLALDSGLYRYSDHYYNYQIRSVAHNTMLVDDPNEPPYSRYIADGGQKVPYGFGSINDTLETVEKKIDSKEAITATAKAKYMGPDSRKPTFSYISSDISAAYTDKVPEYERSAVFINLDNADYPAAFIVYDNIKSKDAAFKKKWLLHSESEPEVDLKTNTTIITRTDNGQNGKLVNKTLIPSAGKAEIEKIGGEGKEFYVNGQNFPISAEAGIQADMGKWRIEVSPKAAAQDDRFLNAMYVTDADRDLPILPIYREYGSNYTGVTVMDKMVTFSSDRENISQSVSLNIRDNGYKSVSCLITDMEAGMWKIDGDGVQIIAEAKSGENCIEFAAAPGRYTITRASSNLKPTAVLPSSYEEEDFGDFSIRKGNNLMYLPKPTKLIDGAAYVALDGIFTQLGASIAQKTENSVTLVTDEDMLTLTKDSDVCILNGGEVKISHAPKEVYGELYACPADFEKFLSIKGCEYNDVVKLLSFSVISKKPLEGVDMTKVINPVEITGSLHDNTNSVDNIYDRDLNTYFCSVGTDAWVLYDLGNVYDVSKLMMAFYRGETRKTLLDIQVSEDGENYKTVFSGKSNGSTSGLQNFKVKEKARFVKVLFHGNDNGVMFNSIYEMLVLTN